MITPTMSSILDLLRTFHHQSAMDTMGQYLVAYLTNTTDLPKPVLDLDQRPTSSSHPHTNPLVILDTNPTHIMDLRHQLPMGHQNFNTDHRRSSMDHLNKTMDHRNYRTDHQSLDSDHQNSEDLSQISMDPSQTLEEIRFNLGEE